MTGRRLHRCLCALLGAVVLVAAVLSHPLHAFADYQMKPVEIDATVESDGTLNVYELRTFSFNGSYHGVYWNIPYGTYQGRQVAGEVFFVGEYVNGQLVELQRSDSGADRTYQLTDKDGYLEVKLFSPHDGGDVQYVLHYVFPGLATRYDDVAELYWKFVSDGWGERSQDVTCTVHLPVPEGAAIDPGDNVRAWGHGPLDATVGFDGDGVVLRVPGVGTDEFAETRVTFPAGWLPDAASTGTSALDRILSEEARWANEANAVRIAKLAISGISIAFFLLSPIALIVYVVVEFRHYRREHRLQFDDKYYRDMPSDDHPSLLGWIYDSKRSYADVGGHLLTCAVMRLCDLGYVRLDRLPATPGGAASQEGGAAKKDGDYALAALVEPDQVPADTPAGLVDRATMHLLFDELAPYDPLGEDDGGVLHFSSLEDIARERRADYRKAYDAWGESVTRPFFDRGRDKDERYNPYEQFKSRGWKLVALGLFAWLPVGAVAIFLLGEDAVSDAFVAAGLYFGFWCALIGAVMYGIGRKMDDHDSAETDELRAKLEALRRWLVDFTRLEEAVPQDVVLWDYLLVMAVALGVSDKVVEQLKVAAPSILSDPHLEPVCSWVALRDLDDKDVPLLAFSSAAARASAASYPSDTGSSGGFGGGSDGGYSGSFSSSSGSGGGFSGGGGGGFGGGGGGGAW